MGEKTSETCLMCGAHRRRKKGSLNSLERDHTKYVKVIVACV